MIKITSIIVGLDVGGAENMLARLAREFETKPSIKHNIITLTDIGVIGADIQKYGIQIENVNFKNWYMFPVSFYKLISLLKKSKPDLVQTWMVHADLIGGLAACAAKIPTIVWGVRTTDYGIESRKTQLIRKICAYLSHRVPDSIVCAANSSMASSLTAGYKREIMSVIPNGFEIDSLNASYGKGAQLRKDLGINVDDILIGNIGRFNSAKDHANFIKAAKLVAGALPQTKFLMVGRGIDEKNLEIKSLIDDPILRRNFYLLGERPDVPTCMDALDLFVLSSRSEGFPNVLGEAMAMQVPCVTTDVGDARLLVGNQGVVVPSEDHEILGNAILEVLNSSKEERRQYAKYLAHRVGQEFSQSSITNLYVKHYQNLIQSNQ